MRPALLLATAYAAAIVYASLEPFEGWRMPTEPLFGFLIAPWPRYTIVSDIALTSPPISRSGRCFTSYCVPHCRRAERSEWRSC